MGTRATGSVPIVGREREQDLLRQQLAEMLDGHGSLVLISGEAGIGKTTLVEDLSVKAEEQGSLVLWGHAYDLSVTPPYGPWLEILHAYPQDDPLPPLPPFVDNPEALAAAGRQDILFAEAADFFTSVAAQRPLTLVLDDLHWADQASLDFLRYFARQVTVKRILLVCTYRSDELQRQHALYTLLPLFVREAGAVRIDVRPLDQRGHRALIQSRYALAKPDQVELERYLQDHAEGNPLYAGELLRTVAEEGILTEGKGIWHLGKLERVPVPLLLRQVIEGRLIRLRAETRRLLQVAAVIGHEIPLELWQEVSEASDDALVSAIEQGQTAYLIEEAPVGTLIRFRHPVFREALYAETLAIRRRAWHRKVAEMLEATAQPDPDTVSYHYGQAGDARAAEWLIRAGVRAQRTYAWHTAAARFEAALAVLAEQDAPAVERATLLYRIANMLSYADERRALALLDEARQLSAEAGEQAFAAHFQFFRGLLQCFNGDLQSGLHALEQANSALGAVSDADRDQLRSRLGVVSTEHLGTVVLWLAAAGRFNEAITHSERVPVEEPESLLRAGQFGSSYADGLEGAGFARAFLGQPQEARRLLQQARDFYQAIDHHFQVAVACLLELDFVQLSYFPEQMEPRIRLAVEGENATRRATEALPVGIPPQSISLSNLVLTGAWEKARESATLAYRAGNGSSHVVGGSWLAQIAYKQGDVDLAKQVIMDLLPEGSVTQPGNTWLSHALPLQRVAVSIELDAGDLVRARSWLEAHDSWLDWSGAILGRAEGDLLWARYYHATGDRARARQQAEQAFDLATDPRQPLALIAVLRFLGQLDTEDHHFANANQHLQESLALADACSAPFERALTLLALAEMRAAQSQMDEARTLLAEVRAICEPLGAKPTLERAAALETGLAAGTKHQYPAGLSEREVEVLRLVTQGLTDADVAERLYLSPRTVGTHLRSIYNKLGVNSRAAATRFAVEHHLL